VVARALGHSMATFTLHSSHCIGCNLYDSQRLSPLVNVLYTAGIAVLAYRAGGLSGRSRGRVSPDAAALGAR
jgi:hypothetical protein